jgi:predicted ester cyclase
MDPQANKEVVRRQFEHLNAGDFGAASALWATEGLNHGRKVDRVSIARVYESLHALQEHHTLHELICEGDWVAVRTTCTGVHAAAPKLPVNSGIFTGVAPTQRTYEVQHMHMFKIANGLITEHWATRDDLGTATQVGFTLRAASP